MIGEDAKPLLWVQRERAKCEDLRHNFNLSEGLNGAGVVTSMASEARPNPTFSELNPIGIALSGLIVIGFQDCCDESFEVEMPNFRAIEVDL